MAEQLAGLPTLSFPPYVTHPPQDRVPPPPPFDPADSYWFVGDDQTRVYSSKINAYVDPNSNADYQAFKSSGSIAATVQSESEIWPYVKDRLPLWVYDAATGTFAQPSAGAFSPTQLNAYAEFVRWLTETADIVAGGVPIRMDQRSKLAVESAFTTVQADPNFTTVWDGADGNLYPVGKNEIEAMFADVVTRVDAAFRAYADLKPKIDGGEVTATEQIDAAFENLSEEAVVHWTR